jgi:hypothetical protein
VGLNVNSKIKNQRAKLQSKNKKYGRGYLRYLGILSINPGFEKLGD